MFRGLFSFGKNTSASSAVEFAILTPVFLLMLTGMMAYGIYFGAANSVQQLAADAARVSVAGLTQTERNTLVTNYLNRHGDEYMLIDRDQLTFEIGDDPSDATQYRVRLRYDASDLPIWNLYLPLPLPNDVITYSSTIRRGGI